MSELRIGDRVRHIRNKSWFATIKEIKDDKIVVKWDKPKDPIFNFNKPTEVFADLFERVYKSGRKAKAKRDRPECTCKSGWCACWCDECKLNQRMNTII